jgi:4'-phosphopantetheinyl transferase
VRHTGEVTSSLPHRLQEGEAHVWLARPDEIRDPALLDRYRAILDAGELERHGRGRSEAIRRLFLVSHALVRTSLARYADISPESFEFSEGEHGRPEISSPDLHPRLRFNLSHTQGLAACIVAREIDCGVDVERVGRVKDLGGMARRVFSETERADLDALPEAAQQGRFTDYWALKEAYVKARGKGFQLPMRKISMQIGDDDRVAIAFASGFGDEPRDWQLALSRPGPGHGEYRLGVAMRRGRRADCRISVRQVVPLGL